MNFIVASKRLYLLLALGMIPFAVSYFFPAARIAGFTYDIVLLIVLVVDYELTSRPKLLNATREVADRLSIGRANQVTVTVYNEGATALKCRVKDDRPAKIEADTEEFEFELPASGLSRLVYNLTPKRRGSYQFGNVSIRYLSYLGLMWRQATIKIPRPVKVYSDLKALYDLSVRLSQSSELGELKQRRRGQGTDFASLREYTVGDDSKTIDWKATARRDRPVVRTYEMEKEQRLMVLIDAGRMMISDLEGLARFDHALNAALCLVLTGLSKNDQVGIGIFADRPLAYLPPRRGKGYLKNILDATFDVEPKMVEPDYVGMLSYFAQLQKGRSLMVVLTDLTDPVGSQALLSGLASLAPRHLPFCVTLTDRQVIRIADERIGGPASQFDRENVRGLDVVDGIYRRAVAIDLLNQRELALSVLKRKGCYILDCPPQELSDKLVESYLEIKRRNKL